MTGSPPAAKKPKTQEDHHGGFGKLILFGEHFVVYDETPALVAAVSAKTTCEASFADEPGLTVVDDRPAVPKYKINKKEEADTAIKLVLDHLGVDTRERGLRLRFAGDLTCVSGIGASAAQCVSLARAINALMDKGMTEEEINQAGYEGEKGYHGTPSGIDNTASTYGGFLKFCRSTDGPKFEARSTPEPCHIVYASTGITASTTKVVGDVKKLKEGDPTKFDSLMQKYTALQKVAESQLAKGDWKGLGESCDENHEILQKLTVSCKELDALVAAARKAGALGAKMSGTGRGGLMFAITPGLTLQKKVADALRGIAPQVWTATIH